MFDELRKLAAARVVDSRKVSFTRTYCGTPKNRPIDAPESRGLMAFTSHSLRTVGGSVHSDSSSIGARILGSLAHGTSSST